MHWGIISRTSSYSSNRNVSIAQTGQVVDRNADCLIGWWPRNLHASCCMLTVSNYFIQKKHNCGVQQHSRRSFVVSHEEFFIFVFVHFLFPSLFISYIHFIYSQMKNHTSADESLGHTLFPLVSELLTIKTNGQPWQQMLCWGMA